MQVTKKPTRVGKGEVFMKLYRKPTVTFITFDASDVLKVSQSNFFVGWLDILSGNQGV